MNLILMTSDEVQPRGKVVLTDRRARHIISVLGGRVGQSLRIGVLDGPLGTGMIKAIDATTVTLRCIFNKEVPPVPAVDLVLAMPRPKVLKRLWAPLASLGVARIFLTNAQRVERYYFDTHTLQPEFYEAQLKLGLEQAMDTRLPKVQIHRQLTGLVESEWAVPEPGTVRWVGHPTGKSHIWDMLGANAIPQRVVLAVGPEGGWSPRELTLWEEHGFTPITLGPRTLRTDVAAIHLVGLAQACLQHSAE